MWHQLQRTMVVAMIAVRMVQPSIDWIIHMSPMGDRLVAAIWTMLMRCIMPFRRPIGRAAIRVLGCYFDDMLMDAAAFNVLEVPLIKIIDVVCVPNRDVATSRPMNVRLGSRSHALPFLPFWPPRSPARQYDANSDQTKDHRRAVRIARKTFRRVGSGCPAEPPSRDGYNAPLLHVPAQRSTNP